MEVELHVPASSLQMKETRNRLSRKLVGSRAAVDALENRMSCLYREPYHVFYAIQPVAYSQVVTVSFQILTYDINGYLFVLFDIK
jgi:hypothetical protein